MWNATQEANRVKHGHGYDFEIEYSRPSEDLGYNAG